MTETDRWQGRSFVDVFLGCLSIGLVFCWASLVAIPATGLFEGGEPSGAMAGAFGEGGSDLVLRLAAGLGLLALSFRPCALARGRAPYLAFVGLAIVGGALCCAAAFLGPVPAIAGNLAAGLALGLFVSLWLGRFQGESGGLLVMLLVAACLEQVVDLGVRRFASAGVYAAMALLPVAAVALLAWLRAKRASVAKRPVSRRGRTGWSYGVFACALLLCDFASGPISYGAFGGGVNASMTALLTLVLAVVFMMCPRLDDEIVLAVFALLVGACTAPLLILSDLPAWFDGMPNAAFWAFNMYSLAWFTLAGGQGEGDALLPKSLRGVAAVYLMTVLAEVLGILMPSQAANVVALSCVGVALVIALVNAAPPFVGRCSCHCRCRLWGRGGRRRPSIRSARRPSRRWPSARASRRVSAACSSGSRAATRSRRLRASRG